MIRPSLITFTLLMSLSSACWAVSHTGKVLETMDSGGYTYAKISEGIKEFWIAAPKTPVEVGQTISFSEQMWMPNFTSKTLHRTFANLLFVGKLAQGTTAPPAPRHNAPHSAQSAVKAKAAAAKAPSPEINLDKAMPYTIADLFAKKEELKGKPVLVHGKVAKVSTAIMGTNWIHVKDGTGKPGSDDIIFRAKTDTAAVGDKVDARGVLVTNQDFGFNYQYPVLVEQASVTVVK